MELWVLGRGTKGIPHSVRRGVLLGNSGRRAWGTVQNKLKALPGGLVTLLHVRVRVRVHVRVHTCAHSPKAGCSCSVSCVGCWSLNHSRHLILRLCRSRPPSCQQLSRSHCGAKALGETSKKAFPQGGPSLSRCSKGTGWSCL